jgi:hypothetical protein
MAAEKLLRKCSTSWEAYRYLKDRVHDSCYPIPQGSRYDGSSKRYRCSCTNGKSTAGRMNQFKNIMTRGRGDAGLDLRPVLKRSLRPSLKSVKAIY